MLQQFKIITKLISELRVTQIALLIVIVLFILASPFMQQQVQMNFQQPVFQYQQAPQQYNQIPQQTQQIPQSSLFMNQAPIPVSQIPQQMNQIPVQSYGGNQFFGQNLFGGH